MTEEQKLSELEGKVREHGLFLDAIEGRLRAMKFGMFAGRRKRHRDNVAEAVATSSRGARDIGSQLADVPRALSDKLSEVQDKLDALEKGA